MAQTRKNVFHDQLKKFKMKPISKAASGRRKCDGLCLQGELMSGIRETKLPKGTIKYTFQVLLDYDTNKLVVPQGVTRKDDSLIVQAFSTKKDSELPKVDFEIHPHAVVWMESFRKPEGDVRTGCLLNLYNVEVTYWVHEASQENRYSFNTHTSTVVSMTDRELLNRYKYLPKKVSHFETPQRDQPYRTTPVIVNIGDPSEEDLNQATGFIGTSPTESSLENAKMLLDIDGEERIIFEHPFLFRQWTPDKLFDTGYFQATMWGASDRGDDMIGNAFGITNPLIWSTLGRKLLKGMEGVLIGYVDKPRTLEMDINGALFKAEEDDPKWGIRVKVLRFLCNARENLHRNCYQVTPEFVDKIVFKGETNAQSPYAARNPWSDGIKRGLINMNETMGDRTRLYKDKNVQFWFMCEADISDEERAELLDMTPEVRSACFGQTKKKKDRPPFTFRWKTGIVFAELPKVVTGKRKR